MRGDHGEAGQRRRVYRRFTPGYADLRRLGLDRCPNAPPERRAEVDAVETIDQVREKLASHVGGYDAHDDLTLLSLRRDPS